MIKKQIRGIIIAAAALTLIVLAYFFVFKPMIDRASAVTEETPPLQPGESIGTSNRYYMYDHLDRANMKSIEISNEHGSFKFLNNGNDSFCIEGFETLALDGAKLSSVVTTCGSTLTKAKVIDNASDEKLEEYGLLEPRAYWIVTDNGDRQYKVYVGKELLTGAGYYCMFAGRRSVYVIDKSLTAPLFDDVTSFVTPYMFVNIPQDDYYLIDNFTIRRGKEKILSISHVPEEEKNNPDALVENMLTYPAPYTPDPEVYYKILMGIPYGQGDSTYALLKPDTAADTLRELGFEDPTYTVSFTFEGDACVYMLEETEEGDYLVVSSGYPQIVSKLSKENAEYLEYTLLDWVSPYVIGRNITTVSSIKVESDTVNETFHLVHYKDERDTDAIQVKSDSGLELHTYEETLNFRHFYGDITAISINEDLPEEASPGVPMDEFLANEANRTLKLTITTRNLKTYEYEIYRYSTRKCALIVDGRADFCCLVDMVNLIESDIEKLLNGETVQGTF